MGPRPIQYPFRTMLLHTICTLYGTLAEAAGADASAMLRLSCCTDWVQDPVSTAFVAYAAEHLLAVGGIAVGCPTRTTRRVAVNVRWRHQRTR